MQVRKLAVRVEPDESVTAVYACDLEAMPDALFLRVGSLQLVGRPAHMVDALSRALQQCYSAWSSGQQDGACDGPDGVGDHETETSMSPSMHPLFGVGSRIDGAAVTRRGESMAHGVSRAAWPYVVRDEVERDG